MPTHPYMFTVLTVPSATPVRGCRHNVHKQLVSKLACLLQYVMWLLWLVVVPHYVAGAVCVCAGVRVLCVRVRMRVCMRACGCARARVRVRVGMCVWVGSQMHVRV